MNRIIMLVAGASLFAAALAPAPTTAGAPECGTGLPALKHNVGVVLPGFSVWYRPDVELPDDGGPEPALIGFTWFLLSEDANLYLWDSDCTAVMCESTEPGLAIDSCGETDCCGAGGYEVRYNASPDLVPESPVAFELRWCFSESWACVPL